MINKFSELLGHTLSDITATEYYIEFVLENGERYKLEHDDDCCETVKVEDIAGDLPSMIGEPILLAEEVTNQTDQPPGRIELEPDSYTWTFYKLATNKGYATIRFYGQSNGYYSERVDWHRWDGKRWLTI